MADERFLVPKLHNHNYQSWRFKIEMLLIREELWHVISVAKPHPVTPDWTKADLRARATIGLTVDDSQTSLIRSCTSAKDCWDALKQYHDKGSEVYLLKKLTRLELGENGDMEMHLQEFTGLPQRIAEAGEGIPAKLQVAMLLCSLPDSFDPLVTALEQRPRGELTLDLVKSKLLAEAEKRRERLGVPAGVSERALRTDFGRSRVSYRNEPRNYDREMRLCYHCGKPGHLRRNCRSLKEQEEMNQEEDEGDRAGFKSSSVAFVVGEGEPSPWVVDSGASRHMTDDRRFFSSLKETVGEEVILADGTKAEVSGIGKGVIVGVDGRRNPINITTSS